MENMTSLMHLLSSLSLVNLSSSDPIVKLYFFAFADTDCDTFSNPVDGYLRTFEIFDMGLVITLRLFFVDEIFLKLALSL